MRMSMGFPQALAIGIDLNEFDKRLNARLESLKKELRRDNVGVDIRPTYDGVGLEPTCYCDLERGDINQGFSGDPKDFSWKCPKCHNVFHPRLITSEMNGHTEWTFFGPAQTLDQLRNHAEMLDQQEFKRQSEALYRSAVINFGSLSAAYKAIGVIYPHKETKEIHAWKKIVSTYLGHLPDALIAGAVGKSVSTIRRLRKTLNIPAFRKAEV